MQYNRIKSFKNYTFHPVSYYKESFDKNFSMGAHSHPYIELMYCKQGEFTVNISEGTNKSSPCKKITVAANQFILLDSGVTHSIYFEKTSAIIYNVEWQIGLLDATMREKAMVIVNVSEFFANMQGLCAFANSQKPYAICSDTESLEHHLSRYIDILHEKSNSLEKKCTATARLIQVLTEIDKCLAQTKTDGVIYIKKAQEYISANFTKHVTVSEIAEYASVHKVYLQRLIKQQLGTSLMALINEKRIAKCKRMILETNLTLDEICPHIGFSSRHQLIYEFKQITGYTPSEYKHKYIDRNLRSTITDNYMSVDKNGTPIR